MCRLFVLRSAVSLCEQASLSDAGNSLAAQSRRDARGESHLDGWGVAAFSASGEPRITHSLMAACDDPAFEDLARSLTTTALVAHVRQASVGSKSLKNTHPFAHGRWVFVHNGTLENFADRKAPLLEAIPDDLRGQIQGETDSEHVFYCWLGHLRAMTGNLTEPVDADTLASAMRQTIEPLPDWFPPCEGEVSKFNFVVTDGRLVVATRWGHRLSCCEAVGGPVIRIASEPTEPTGWQEVPDRSMLVVDEELTVQTTSLA